ncbi:MAG: T9SS type A sorting domain-containing protein [Bacteroidota bacterium]
MKSALPGICFICLLLPMGWHGTLGAQSIPFIDPPGIVSNNTSTGDGANSWGGHQCSIVRSTSGEIFTVYTIAGSSDLNRIFRLAVKEGDDWVVIAEGESGREPAQLLIAPDNRLFVVCWLDGSPRIWISDTAGRNFSSSAIPGDWNPNDNWPYLSAGIDQTGRLFVLASGGGKPGYFKIAFRDLQTGEWSAVKKIPLDYRYCYTYLIPRDDDGLYMASLRDVLWSDLGYEQPAASFDYCFNAVKSWYSPQITDMEFAEILVHEEEPEPLYPQPDISFNYNGDFYVDTHHRTHVICPVTGASTGGKICLAHYIYDGKDFIISTDLPAGIKNCRLIQNEDGKFFLITFSQAQLALYPASDANGLVLESPWLFDLAGHEVRYSNLHLAAPRCGVPLSGEVDLVYPSGVSSNEWIHVRLHLSEGGPSDTLLVTKKEIRIFPVPVDQTLHIQGLDDSGDIALYDMRGIRVFYRENVSDQVDIGSLAPGSYILQLKSKRELIHRLIIKH